MAMSLVCRIQYGDGIMTPKRHVMTPARKAALRKAQLASARKRRKRKYIKKGKKIAVGAVVIPATIGAVNIAYIASGTSAHKRTRIR